MIKLFSDPKIWPVLDPDFVANLEKATATYTEARIFKVVIPPDSKMFAEVKEGVRVAKMRQTIAMALVASDFMKALSKEATSKESAPEVRTETLQQGDVPGVDISHHFGTREYIKRTVIKAGTSLQQHKHPYNHLSVCVSGRAVLTSRKEADGISDRRYLDAGEVVEVRAGVEHMVLALTDVVWLCIHGIDADTPHDPKIVDQTILTR